MRRSTIWFLIAFLWMIDVFITVARGHGRQAWLPAVIAAVFAATGAIFRSREKIPAKRRPVK